MQPLDCPFRTAETLIDSLKAKADVIIVDFHAEATSEKMAMGWFLDGKVSAVLGTHTHVPTADCRILPSGTAYVTDVGMTGAYDSIIGMQVETALHGIGLPGCDNLMQRSRVTQPIDAPVTDFALLLELLKGKPTAKPRPKGVSHVK